MWWETFRSLNSVNCQNSVLRTHLIQSLHFCLNIQVIRMLWFVWFIRIPTIYSTSYWPSIARSLLTSLPDCYRFLLVYRFVVYVYKFTNALFHDQCRSSLSSKMWTLCSSLFGWQFAAAGSNHLIDDRLACDLTWYDQDSWFGSNRKFWSHRKSRPVSSRRCPWAQRLLLSTIANEHVRI